MKKFKIFFDVDKIKFRITQTKASFNFKQQITDASMSQKVIQTFFLSGYYANVTCVRG